MSVGYWRRVNPSHWVYGVTAGVRVRLFYIEKVDSYKAQSVETGFSAYFTSVNMATARLSALIKFKQHLNDIEERIKEIKAAGLDEYIKEQISCSM